MNPVLQNSVADSAGCASSADLAAHLVARAAEYFPELAGRNVDARLVRRIARTNSRLFEFEIGDAAARRGVIVKIPNARKDLDEDGARPASSVHRPRLSPRPDPLQKGRHEYLAMEAIYERLGALDPSRFGVIRMLELLPSPYTLVMERSDNAPLVNMFRRAHRFRRRQARDLAPVFYNAGCWLRSFHGLAPFEHTKTRQATRGEAIQAVRMFTDYLVEHCAPRLRYERLRDTILELTARLTPEALPLGLCHGDYAPRNLLVGPAARVTVFDTQARWQTPIYEDIGHFLVALKASGLQITFQGALFDGETLACFEDEFLCGYFAGQDLPLEQIRLYECLRLLEWWTSLIFRYRECGGWRRAAKGARMMVWTRFLSGYVDQLVAELVDGSPPENTGAPGVC